MAMSVYPLLRESSISRQFNIIARQLVVEFDVAADVLLCDRTILDHWCYTIALFDELLDAGARQAWSKFVADRLGTYNLIVYLPPEVAAQDDGVREADREFQQRIDDLILTHLAGADARYVTVRGTLEERAQHCETLIESLLGRQIGETSGGAGESA
jgi:nicotinamide riboside kinase